MRVETAPTVIAAFVAYLGPSVCSLLASWTTRLMTTARVDALQSRCGSWVEKVVKRYGPALASRPAIEIRPGSMNAAKRLLALEGTGT